jgi:hypothetical protein
MAANAQAPLGGRRNSLARRIAEPAESAPIAVHQVPSIAWNSTALAIAARQASAIN